jgi:uncharacterized protein DUF1707/2TM domain-containing protein
MPETVTSRPLSAGDLRVGDVERESVASQLADHHAAGRLTFEELDDRLTATWSARTRAELAATLADLPTPAPPAPTPPARRPSSAAVAGWRMHLVSYLTVIAGLWLIWALTGSGYPWPIWPMLGWGLGLLGQSSRLTCGQLRMPARG